MKLNVTRHNSVWEGLILRLSSFFIVLFSAWLRVMAVGRRVRLWCSRKPKAVNRPAEVVPLLPADIDDDTKEQTGIRPTSLAMGVVMRNKPDGGVVIRFRTKREWQQAKPGKRRLSRVQPDQVQSPKILYRI